MSIGTAELLLGAAELDRRAYLGHAAGVEAMAGVQADLLRPRSEWTDPATPTVVAESVVGMGAALHGDLAYAPPRVIPAVERTRPPQKKQNTHGLETGRFSYKYRCPSL